MARSRELKVVIAGDADKLERELRKSNTSLDKLGKQTRLTSTITSKGFAGMRVAAVGAAGALGGIAIAGKRVVTAAIEAEKAQARMVTQLKASGISYAAHARQIETVIQKHSQLAGLDDEELQDAFTNIVRVTGDVDKSLRLTGLAADFARAKHMDVAKAGELVGKVAGGNIGILSRYGITIDKGASATEALGVLQQKFAGQAEAYGKTTGGSVDRANVAFENLQETIGQAAAPAVEKLANKTAKFVNEMQSGTGQGGRFADTLKDIWTEARPIVTWIGRAAANTARFTAEHPNVGKLAAAVVGVGLAVKGLRLVSAATGFTTLLKAGRTVMTKLVAHFAKQGAVAGAAAGSAAAGGQGLTSAATFNKTRNAGSRLGRVGGRALGVGMAAGLLLAFPDIFKKVDSFENQLRDKLFGVGKDIAGKLNPFGDGVGIPLPKGGGGDLKGADADLGPFAAIGRGMGLAVSSGLRPGSITKSGNLSHHASGDAIDMSGPPGKMLAYFRALKARYGSRLAELIYTPGGAGIKNGRPHTYTGEVAADHYDHVHVAYTGGGGSGRRVARGPQGLRGDGYGIGDGTGESVVGAFRRAIRRAKAPPKAALALFEAGIVESGLRNLTYGDRDSKGALQLRVSLHGEDLAMDPYRSALAFLTRGFTGRGGAIALSSKLATAGQVAQAVQGSAYPDRYDQVRARALGYLEGAAAAKAKGGKSSSSRSRGGASRGGASQNTHGRHGATMGGTGGGSSSYEQDLADADLAIAGVEAGDEAVGGSPAALREAAAVSAKRKVIGQRIQKVRAALRKRNLRPATRLRLTQELGQLLGEHRSLGEQGRQLRTAPAVEVEAGDTEDPNQALIDALEAKAEQDRQLAEEQARRDEEIRQAHEAQAQALREVKAAIDLQNQIASSAVAVSLREATRFIAGAVSGEVAQNAGQRGTMPGDGRKASVGPNSRY